MIQLVSTEENLQDSKLEIITWLPVIRFFGKVFKCQFENNSLKSLRFISVRKSVQI